MKTKTILAAIMAVSLAIPLVANAETVTANGATWTYSVNNASQRTVTLGGGGTQQAPVQAVPLGTELQTTDIPWVFTSESDGQTYTVTKIESFAFYNITNLVGMLTIPDSVTEIGDRAFEHCLRLSGISLGPNLTKLGQYVFNETKLSCQAPNIAHITSFGNGPFQTTYMSGKVMLNESLTTVPARLFNQCRLTGSVVIPSSVTSVDETVFNENSALEATWVKGRPTVAVGNTQNYTTVKLNNLFRKCSKMKIVLFGPNTQPNSSSTLTSNWQDMSATDKDGFVFLPKVKWEGFTLHDSANASVVFYGEGEDLDLKIDDGAKTITAFPNTAAALQLVLDNAAKFKSYFDLDTKIAITNSLSGTVAVSAEDLQNVAFVTYVTFAASTQTQLDNTLSALPPALPVVIDATDAKSTINVPAGRNVAVLVPGGGKYGPVQNGLIISVH